MTRVVRPLLGHSIVHADGRRVRSLRVFCARIARTLSLEACERCPAFREHVEDESEDGHIECVADGPGPTPHSRPPAADHDGAGALVSCAPPSVRVDVSARDVATLLAETGAPYMLVVDEENHVVGAIWSTAAHLSGVAPGATAVELMTTARVASERATIHATLLQMATSHLRWISIVADDGTPVGVLRDVDALRAWARRRSAK
jgi:hypothetical protein